MNHRVIISIASNRNQRKNLATAREHLREVLTAVSFTSELWTEPYGTHHSNTLYLNQLAHGVFEGTMSELVTRLKQLETAMGRTEQERRMGIVEIDLDLMRYDHQRMHLSDWDRPFFQKLILELDNITRR